MIAAAAALADRWAELWDGDVATMVREIYAPDVVVEHAGHGPRSRAVGRDALMDAERRLLEMIPDHRNEIVRVLDAGDGRAVVECVISGTGARNDVRNACPALVWWTRDSHGQVSREVAYWEWRKRRPLDDSVRGTMVPATGSRTLSSEDAWALASRLAALWSEDPVAMARTMYSVDTVMERLGEGDDAVVRGRDELVAAETALLALLPCPQRRMEVHDVLVDGCGVAVAFTIEGSWRGSGPRRRGPGALVLTLGDDDLIVSDRIYWHWDLARELP